MVWKMNGTNAGEIKKIKTYQGLDLMLEKNQTGLEQYILQTLLGNSNGLLLYLGNQLHGSGLKGYGVISGKIDRKQYVYFFPLLGLLLYKLNQFKEDYMGNMPYLLGQILKISDELHAFYCKVVRKGEVPPQLAGNSLLVTAMETPGRVLAQLCSRINPYLSWAKQYRTKNCLIKGEESWKAGWYLNLYGENADILKAKFGEAQNYRFNDIEKSQLFIGYLADFPKKSENPKSKAE
jgi:hypothetical protein